MIYKEGDISLAPEVIIIHGCNAKGVMGSGVAKALRARFPDIFDSYVSALLGGYTLGDPVIVHTKTKIIGNLITQEAYGYDNKQYASVDAIRTALYEFVYIIKYQYQIEPIPAIASPKIGCGRGGLSWENEVKKIYEELEQMENVEFVIYEMKDEFSKD